MESFFSSLKIERIGRKVYRTRDAARADVFDYIENFYNVSSEHTSRYIVDTKRLCWATSCSAGCFEDREDSSASLRAAELFRSRRLKTQGRRERMDRLDVSTLCREPQGSRRHTDNSGGLA